MTTLKRLSVFTIFAITLMDVSPLSAAANTTLGDTCSVHNGQQAITAVTPSDVLGPFYIPNTAWRNRLAPEEQLNDPTLKLTISGTVLGNDCIPMSHVLVEPWYAGLPDENGNEYTDQLYRGQVLTDECGRFELVATFPEVYPARPIRHVHFRFSSVRNMSSTTTTTAASSRISGTISNSSSNVFANYSTLVREELFLTTQMYFEGYIIDGFLPDPVQIAALSINEADGSKFAEWDVRLNIPGTSLPSDNCRGVQYNSTNGYEATNVEDAASSGRSMGAIARGILPGILTLIGTATSSIMS